MIASKDTNYKETTIAPRDQQAPAPTPSGSDCTPRTARRAGIEGLRRSTVNQPWAVPVPASVLAEGDGLYYSGSDLVAISSSVK